MRKIIFVFIAAIIVLSFGDCQKRIFRNVHVKGRIISFITNQPVEGVSVFLSADDVTSGKQSQLGSVEIAEGKTNSEGVYNLEGKASRRNNYYVSVQFEDIAGDQINGDGISLKMGRATNDLGDYVTTIEPVKYKINVVLSSAFKDTLIFNSTKKLTGGQSIVFYEGLQYTKSIYDANNHAIKGFYSIKKGSQPITIKDTSYSVPITSNYLNEVIISY